MDYLAGNVQLVIAIFDYINMNKIIDFLKEFTAAIKGIGNYFWSISLYRWVLVIL